jgi:hypothetical protein
MSLRTNLQADHRSEEQQDRGDRQAGLHAGQEGFRAGDQRAEDGDGDRPADLAEGVNTALAVPA